jgi:type II secretory pathway component GspD/PulD (secretin)
MKRLRQRHRVSIDVRVDFRSVKRGVLLGLAFSLSSLIGAEFEAPSSQAVDVEAQLAVAESSLARGDMSSAREIALTILAHNAGNESARQLLVKIDRMASGVASPVDQEYDKASIERESILADARMRVSRSELLASDNRFDEALTQLSQARVSLHPYQQYESARSEIERIDSQVLKYREQSTQFNQKQRSQDREQAIVDARERQAFHEKAQVDLMQARISRVEELEAKGFYESALAACRRLISDYPSQVECEKLYARLLTKAHKSRDLSLADQHNELLEETVARLERSLIPSGFDGWPAFPVNWSQREQRDNVLSGQNDTQPWEDALNEKLAIRLTYDIMGQNVVEVLMAFAKQAKVNLIIDPSILAGGDKLITLRASDMSLKNTLSWVCQQAETNWRLDKGAVYVGGTAEEKTVLAVYEAADLLFVPKDQPGKQLSFSNGANTAGGGGLNLFQNTMDEPVASITPEDLIDLIQKAVTPKIWDNNEFGITVRGTTLLVTAPQKTHALIKQFIRSQSLVKNKLVRIEARWLTIEDGYLEEIGVDWRSPDLLALPNYTGPAFIGGVPNPAGTPNNNGVSRLSSDFDVSGSLSNKLAASASNNVPTVGTGLNLQTVIMDKIKASAIIHAVERTKKGNVLQAPTVTTINGVRANVFVGDQIAYIGDYSMGAGAGAFSATLDPEIMVLNVGATLDVTPFISADGKYVQMEFKPSIASLEQIVVENIIVTRFYPRLDDGDEEGGVVGEFIDHNFPLELPNVLVRQAATSVQVPDGSTILVGGFGKLIDQQMSSHIPFLGHIPFVGRLFGKRGRYSDRSKLYLLADIHIINYAELEAKL